MLDLLNGPVYTDENISVVSDMLEYFLVFKQKNLLYKIFGVNEQWKDRFKPFNYALMHEMQEEYPKEFKDDRGIE